MTEPAKSVSRAEERAYAGQNESQDSQLIFEKARIEHGVGIVSGTPPILPKPWILPLDDVVQRQAVWRISAPE